MHNLTEAQAILYSGFLTVIAGIVAAVLGGLLFGGRVKSLQEAIRQSEAGIQKHLGKLDSSIENINKRSQELDEVIAALSEKTASIQSSVSESDEDGVVDQSEIESDFEEKNDASEALQKQGIDAVENNPRKEILADWRRAKERTESIASSPKIDGRTRAKYLRIDRRRYGDLIKLLEADDQIQSSEFLWDAYEIWKRVRPNRYQATRLDAHKSRNAVSQFLRDNPDKG